MEEEPIVQAPALFAVVCGEVACRRVLTVLPQSISHIAISGNEAVVTVDLSPAEGREPFRFCDRSTCGDSFATATTDDPERMVWLQAQVPAERIEMIDPGVAVLRRRA